MEEKYTCKFWYKILIINVYRGRKNTERIITSLFKIILDVWSSVPKRKNTFWVLNFQTIFDRNKNKAHDKISLIVLCTTYALDIPLHTIYLMYFERKMIYFIDKKMYWEQFTSTHQLISNRKKQIVTENIMACLFSKQDQGNL